MGYFGPPLIFCDLPPSTCFLENFPTQTKHGLFLGFLKASKERELMDNFLGLVAWSIATKKMLHQICSLESCVSIIFCTFGAI